jgi:hypothetical protein
MSSTKWRTLANVLFVLGFASTAGVGWAWWSCTDTLVQVMDSVPDLDDHRAMAERVRYAQSAFEASGQSVPTEINDRTPMATQACGAAFPISESLPFLTLFIIFLLGGVVARNHSKHIEEDELEEHGKARHASRTASSVALREPEPEPLKPVTSIAIDVGIDLKTGESPAEDADDGADSLMSFVVERARAQGADSDGEIVGSDIGGFFCPPGYEDRKAIYVDPSSEAARDDYTDDTPFNAPQYPFKSLDGAMKFAAMRIVRDIPGMQVRLAPGVYQSSVAIPDRVVLVNHRMPIEGTLTQRLKWITDLELNDPARVTILPPATSEFAIRFGAGVNQGIFGCHLVGREGVAQAGIVGAAAHRLAIFNCHIEGFRRGGIRLDQCGTEVPGNGTRVMACGVLQNAASEGGGIHATKSVIRITTCMISGNRARNGGGLWLSQMKAPVIINDSRFSHNLAKGPELEEALGDLALNEWARLQGTGGAVMMFGGTMKIVGSEFVDNTATLGGGGLAILGGKAVLEGTAEHAVRFVRNKARAGAGFLVCGWPGAEATLKLTKGDLQHNISEVIGGAGAALGLSTVQVSAAKVSNNQATDRTSVGGGFGAMNGAEFITKEVEFRANICVGSGGALGAVNASLRLGEGTDLRDNSASHAGGGIYIITESHEEIAGLIGQGRIKIPFVLVMKDCVVSSNSADDLGAGLRAGNAASEATFALGIRMEGASRIRNNRTKHPNAAGDDVWVVWIDDVVASTENRPGPKLLLK